jgi:hypothetical protein
MSSAKKTLIPLCFVSDGRTPQQVFKDKRWLGNSRIAPCSHVLKQETCLNWVQNNCDTSVKLIVGIDWSEIHRLSKIKSSWEPWDVLAPLCDPPYWDKLQCQHEISKLGICLPLLYSKGFPHNNCGGACVRGGKAQWRKLLKYFPERFLEWEDHEKEMQNLLQKPVTILKDISLANLREQVNNSEIQLDLFDLGGCGCFMD